MAVRRKTTADKQEITNNKKTENIMIIMPVKEGENIERALKKFKRKYERTGVLKELRARLLIIGFVILYLLSFYFRLVYKQERKAPLFSLLCRIGADIQRVPPFPWRFCIPTRLPISACWCDRDCALS